MVVRRRTVLTFLVAILIILVAIAAFARLQAYRRQIMDQGQKPADETLEEQAESLFPSGAPSPGTATLPGQGQIPAAGANNTSGFFARTRLSRDRARSQEMELLQRLVDDQATDAQTRNRASERLFELTKRIGQEASIEGLLVAKGFPEAVVMLEETGAIVLVEAATLDKLQVAQVADVVYRVAGIAPDKVTVIGRP